MKDRLLIGGIFLLGGAATIIDFASKIMSIFADGLLMIAMGSAVVVLHRAHAARVKVLIQERDEARLALRSQASKTSAAVW